MLIAEHRAGIGPGEFRRTPLKRLLRLRQIDQREQWRLIQQLVGLRNDVRGALGADPIELPGRQSRRDEEEIDALLDDWSGWLDHHTN